MPPPDFTAAQCRQLAALDVVPEQIAQLRIALVSIAIARIRAPARNDVKGKLSKVAKHADALGKLLRQIEQRATSASRTAYAAIEMGYWKTRPGEDPLTVEGAHSELAALAAAARAGMAEIPREQTRHRTADWRPIRAIEDALLLGWARQHSLAYPRKFRPSESASGTFSKIVATCFEAAGAPRDSDPRAAIRAYLRVKKTRQLAILRAEGNMQ